MPNLLAGYFNINLSCFERERETDWERERDKEMKCGKNVRTERKKEGM